jgi:poly-gamma-glutamate synthase PgsB/CapB
MGPEEPDVARSLLGTTPLGATLFTCERDYPDEFQAACSARGGALVVISPEEIASLSDGEMSRFSYVEHRENVALALRVCESLGVDRETALRGMTKAEPDPGSMSDLRLDFFGRVIYFVNGFAANDPESTETLWRMALERHGDVERRIMIINSRIDRPDRSRQLGKALASWPRADRYILIGSGSYFVERYAARAGVETRVFTTAEDLGTEIIFEEILKHCGRRTLVIGIGNIAGPGLELATYFKNRSEPLPRH